MENLTKAEKLKLKYRKNNARQKEVYDRIEIFLPKETGEKFKKICKECGITYTEFVESVIDDYLSHF